MILGVTGGVGTGKSTILSILEEEFHAAVILSDDVARTLMEPGEKPYQEIVSYFGEGILTDGAGSLIDRKLLASVVFDDPEKLQVLNGFVHPAVKERILSLIAQYEQEGYPIIAVESAILLEAGYRPLIDELWAIHTDRDVRYERLQASRGYSKEKTDSIMANQMDPEVLEQEADFVLDNSRDLEHVRKQIQDHFHYAGNPN